MAFPHPPKPIKLSRLSPSSYEAARSCKARAAWLAAGDRSMLPGNPAAMLGACFHHIAAAAQRGHLQSNSGGVEEAARDLFNQIAEKLFAESHEIFKVKFGVKERLPSFYLRREEAVALACMLASGTSRPSVHRTLKPKLPLKVVEQSLQSQDGLLYGRPDYINAETGEVVDYKTRRASPDGNDEVTKREMRQLRLYAYLTQENGIEIKRGAIVLADGTRVVIELDKVEVEREAHAAARALEAYNAAVTDNATFRYIASPSAETCSYCPCIVMCEPFWEQANPTWRESVGAQVHGKVISISRSNFQGINVLTMHLEYLGGTIERSVEVVLEQIPEKWLLGEMQSEPQPGDEVRIISARTAVSTSEQTVVRADRATTDVWIRST